MQSTFSQLGQGLGREGKESGQSKMGCRLIWEYCQYLEYSNNLNILLHQAKDRACSRVWGGMWTDVWESWRGKAPPNPTPHVPTCECAVDILYFVVTLISQSQ